MQYYYRFHSLVYKIYVLAKKQARQGFALCFLFFVLLFNPLMAQTNKIALYEDYIKQFRSKAMGEMKQYKIPASITLAQGLLESGAGRSLLATEANNHFGIKCKETWVGETYTYDDDIEGECFRKYKSAGESYRDHSLFLVTRSRYAGLFKLQANDYKGWARGLKKAGYATNPKYAEQLIGIIEDYKLYQYDDPNWVGTKEEEVFVADNEIKPSKATVAAQPLEKPVVTQPKKEDAQKIEALDASNYSFSYTSSLGRKVYINADVPFVFAQQGDTWQSIAQEFDIFTFQVYTQNDRKKDDLIEPGQMIYLEPKNRKNQEGTYTTKGGETLHYISQLKAVKLRNIIKYNKNLAAEKPLDAGVLVNLK